MALNVPIVPGFIVLAVLCCLLVDSSMFVLATGVRTLIILLYMDDIILTGNSTSMLTALVGLISSIFAMKDLRDLHYFLGTQAILNSFGIFLFITEVC